MPGDVRGITAGLKKLLGQLEGQNTPRANQAYGSKALEMVFEVESISEAYLGARYGILEDFRYGTRIALRPLETDQW